MSQVSRPMQILLAGTVLFALVWFVALRPKPASTGDTAAAPAVQEAPATTPADPAPATAPADPAPARKEKTTRIARARPGDTPQVRAVRGALRAGKAVAIAFVAPTVADARAVAHELREVGDFGGKVVTVEAPLSDLARYGFITREVEVTAAPTIVIVTPKREASTIVGFADRFEIEQRLADALS